MISKEVLDYIIFIVLFALIIIDTVWNVKYNDTHEDKYLYRGLATSVIGIVLSIVWFFV